MQPLILLSYVLVVCSMKNESINDESLFNWNDTTSTVENDLELTTPFYLDLNSTIENSTDYSSQEIIESTPVKRILREIFRTFEPYCWRHSYGRGVGYPLNACPDDAPEQDGLLCYPECRPGFNGVGPMCWQKCDNITSFGLICLDFQTSLRSCPWYDKCGIFKRSCTSCPEEYMNFGCVCGRFYIRDSYSRGLGATLTCSKDYEQDGALCYDKCDKKYNGVGPVCWQFCPSTQPYPCFAGCSTTKETCQNAVINMVQSVVGASVTLLNTIIGAPLIDLTTIDILANAAKGDWILVAKHLSGLAKQLAEKLLPVLSKTFLKWPSFLLESATKNASISITAAAFKDKKSLLPILKFFRLDAINSAFNHGKCDFDENFEDIISY